MKKSTFVETGIITKFMVDSGTNNNERDCKIVDL